MYEAYIKRQLGPALETARVKSGGRVRVEASGEALLRTICKLTHIGPKQYAKGRTTYFHCPKIIFVSVALLVFPLLLSRSLFFPLVATILFPLLPLAQLMELLSAISCWTSFLTLRMYACAVRN